MHNKAPYTMLHCSPLNYTLLRVSGYLCFTRMLTLDCRKFDSGATKSVYESHFPYHTASTNSSSHLHSQQQLQPSDPSYPSTSPLIFDNPPLHKALDQNQYSQQLHALQINPSNPAQSNTQLEPSSSNSQQLHQQLAIQPMLLTLLLTYETFIILSWLLCHCL